MKTLGLIGGITWESTVTYYEIINRETKRRLGGVHSAKLFLHSVDFEEIVALQRDGRWQDGAAMLGRAGAQLASVGSELLVLCCNTMHLVAAEIETAAGVPLLHIADPLGEAICAAGISRVGLLGTAFTMREPGILSERLKERHGIDVVVPDGADAKHVHRIIYEFQNRGAGGFPESERSILRRIAAGLVERGADGIILGCTELPLMLTAEDCAVPLFDTATLHALAAVDAALSGG